MNIENNLKAYAAPQLIELSVRETQKPKKDQCDNDHDADDLLPVCFS
jgi:hypothetical protein